MVHVKEQAVGLSSDSEDREYKSDAQSRERDV